MLDEFLRNGGLGPLKVGMGRAEVVTMLGPPIAHSARRARSRHELWRYGDLQVIFECGRICSITVFSLVPRCAPPAAVDLTSSLEDKLTLDRFRRHLGGRNIEADVDTIHGKAFPDSTLLRITGGAGIYFDGIGNRASLHSLGFPQPRQLRL